MKSIPACHPERSEGSHHLTGFFGPRPQNDTAFLRNLIPHDSIDIMIREIGRILGDKLHSIWLYGSLVLDDFRLGWSDIDFLALTEAPLSQAQAEALLMLRQHLSTAYPDNPYYRLFEGIITDRQAYLTGRFTRLVYWGTSGQRITDQYEKDIFAEYELARYGRLLAGVGERAMFPLPGREELVAAIRRHYAGIRRFGSQTDESLYACGWLLDIARCLYTLRTGDVIGKSQAGAWALRERIFPEAAPLEKALMIREAPWYYKDDPEIRAWLKDLGPTVQAYADVLGQELSRVVAT